MIWLASWDYAVPLSYSGAPVATTTIGYYTFNLWTGSEAGSGYQTLSFVATQNPTESFSGDLKPFFDYLVDNGYVDGSQYLTSVGAGTEAFDGTDCVLSSTYSCAVYGY